MGVRLEALPEEERVEPWDEIEVLSGMVPSWTMITTVGPASAAPPSTGAVPIRVLKIVAVAPPMVWHLAHHNATLEMARAPHVGREILSNHIRVCWLRTRS